ncbi:hypothetical protein, partial [Actinotalea sp. C106]|uniref:hypothetical protein n=1 Tax=Actinotalea sp. C106 TaxID=2908644 RepID=UPI002028C175
GLRLETLQAAVALGGAVEVELHGVAGDRGVLAVLRTDGVLGTAVVRGIDVLPQGAVTATRPRPGIEVSVFPVAAMLDEVLRLVPAAAETDVADADVPVELSVALGRALREGRTQVVEALTADLGLEEPPAVVGSLARTLDGQLALTVRSHGSARTSLGTWLRCDAGWVEILPMPGDVLRHRVRTREDIGRTLLTELTGRVDRALTAAQEAG